MRKRICVREKFRFCGPHLHPPPSPPSADSSWRACTLDIHRQTGARLFAAFFWSRSVASLLQLLACCHHYGRHVLDGLPLERNDGKPCGHCIGTVRRTASLKPQATYARPTAVFKAFFPPTAVSRQFMPTCYTYSKFMVKYCIKIHPCHFIWMRMRREGVDQQVNSRDGYSESAAAQRVHNSSSSSST